MVFKNIYCLMQVKNITECSAMFSNFIKLPFVIKIFVLSILSGRFTQVLLYTKFPRTFFTVTYIIMQPLVVSSSVQCLSCRCTRRMYLYCLNDATRAHPLLSLVAPIFCSRSYRRDIIDRYTLECAATAV